MVLLVLGVIALVAALNALRPVRGPLLFFPGFLAGWLTTELAPWVLATEAVAATIIVAIGGLDAWPSQVGLAATVISWVVLAAVMARAWKTTITVRNCGAELELDPDDTAPAFPRSHVVFPFLMSRRPGVERIRDIVYTDADGPRLRLDVYRPTTEDARRPGIMEIHGGGWLVGSKQEQGVPLMNHLAANGWVGINVNYRLSPLAMFPDHVIDLKRAIAWYREHAAEYGADPDFLCVTGGSAGGHLAALVALTANDPAYQPGFEDVDTSVRAAVPFYGVYDFPAILKVWPRFVAKAVEQLVVRRRLVDDPEAFAKASPITHINADAPPFFVIHGAHDSLIPAALARTFVERLRSVSRAPVVYGEMHGAQHAFDIFPSYRTARVIEGVERFLAHVHRQAVRSAQDRMRSS